MILRKDSKTRIGNIELPEAERTAQRASPSMPSRLILGEQIPFRVRTRGAFFPLSSSASRHQV